LVSASTAPVHSRDCEQLLKVRIPGAHKGGPFFMGRSLHPIVDLPDAVRRDICQERHLSVSQAQFMALRPQASGPDDDGRGSGHRSKIIYGFVVPKL